MGDKRNKRRIKKKRTCTIRIHNERRRALAKQRLEEGCGPSLNETSSSTSFVPNVNGHDDSSPEGSRSASSRERLKVGRSPKTCWFCKGEGHTRTRCPLLKNGNQQKTRRPLTRSSCKQSVFAENRLVSYQSRRILELEAEVARLEKELEKATSLIGLFAPPQAGSEGAYCPVPAENDQLQERVTSQPEGSLTLEDHLETDVRDEVDEYLEVEPAAEVSPVASADDVDQQMMQIVVSSEDEVERRRKAPYLFGCMKAETNQEPAPKKPCLKRLNIVHESNEHLCGRSQAANGRDPSDSSASTNPNVRLFRNLYRKSNGNWEEAIQGFNEIMELNAE